MWIETDIGVVNLDFVAAIAQRDDEVRLLLPPTNPDFWLGTDAFVKIKCKTPADASWYYSRIVKQLNVTQKPVGFDDPVDPE